MGWSLNGTWEGGKLTIGKDDYVVSLRDADVRCGVEAIEL